MKHDFRKMEIWQESFDVVLKVYKVTEQLPSDERYGLKSQLQRCAVSVPSNIAEGSGRTSDKEFLYFLNVAISSSYELETQLLLCKSLFDIEVEDMITQLQSVQRRIGGLKRKIVANK